MNATVHCGLLTLLQLFSLLPLLFYKKAQAQMQPCVYNTRHVYYHQLNVSIEKPSPARSYPVPRGRVFNYIRGSSIHSVPRCRSSERLLQSGNIKVSRFLHAFIFCYISMLFLRNLPLFYYNVACNNHVFDSLIIICIAYLSVSLYYSMSIYV